MSRGINRERQVRVLLRNEGWVVIRAAGSLGVCDLVACRIGERTRFIEVKATAGGPYEHFGPASRHELGVTAYEAGGDAWLAYWPPRGKLTWIPEREWPISGSMESALASQPTATPTRTP